MKKYIWRICIFVFYAAYSFIYVGWVFHKSEFPRIFQYSLTYFLFLVAMFSLFLLPLGMRFYKKSLGFKGLLYCVIPLAVLLFILYSAASFVYYRPKLHLFDIFLQVPNPVFSAPKDKPADTYRILCVGGSTTECGGFPEDERYHHILQKLLQKKYPSVKIEVLNGAKAWYTTKHSLISYVTYCRYWHADLVIIMHGINDFYRSFSPDEFAIGPYNDEWTHYYGPVVNLARPVSFEQFLWRKIIYCFLDNWYSESGFIRRDIEIDYPLEKYVSIKMFEDNLRSMIDYARADKSQVMLLTQPFLYKERISAEEKKLLWFGKQLCSRRLNIMQKEYPSAKSLERAMNAFNAVVRDVSDSEHSYFADVEKSIPKNLAYFTDDCHYTYKGSELLAKVVAEGIIGAGIVDNWVNDMKK